MQNPVIQSYENYKEEDRLTTNNARKIEFITTAKILDEWVKPYSKILDCAAGTGVYAHNLAAKGHFVTATDITPRHIEVLRCHLQTKPYTMDTYVLDVTDLSIFGDDSFDVVLNMGPFYHLIDEGKRKKCLSECLRVLKRGGLLVTAYIPRFYIFPYVALTDENYLNARLANQLRETGVLKSDDEMCFWTDTYYATAKEMETVYIDNNIQIVDHFAQDGITPLFADKVDMWGDAQFKIWCDYHYSVCREPSALGASNHAAIIGKK